MLTGCFKILMIISSLLN